MQFNLHKSTEAARLHTKQHPTTSNNTKAKINKQSRV